MVTMLSQTDPAVEIWIWGGGVLVAILVLSGAVVVVRRLLYGKVDDSSHGGLSLEKLEELCRDGRISRDEFKMIRNNLLGFSGGTHQITGQKDNSGLTPESKDDDGNEDPAEGDRADTGE